MKLDESGCIFSSLIRPEARFPSVNLRNLGTEYFDGSSFVAGPQLPEARSSPCGAEVEAGLYFIAGSFRTNPERAYLHRERTGTWTRLPDMPDGGRELAACGVTANKAGRKELVVAGGLSRSNIVLSSTLLFSFENNQWRDGPSLPKAVGYAAHLPYGDSLLVIGGFEERNANPQDAVYQLTGDGWVAWDQRLGSFNTIKGRTEGGGGGGSFILVCCLRTIFPHTAAAVGDL